jgi:hemerythrin
MVKYNYPDYPSHKQYHEEFKKTVAELHKRFIDEGPTPKVVGVVTTTIGIWLINHIKGIDGRMAEFIKSKDKS